MIIPAQIQILIVIPAKPGGVKLIIVIVVNVWRLLMTLEEPDQVAIWRREVKNLRILRS